LKTNSLQISMGSKVHAGDVIGRLGFWNDGIHLHFGMHPGDKPVLNQMGLVSLPGGWREGDPVNIMGWVNPIQWIETQQPINDGDQTRGDLHPFWDPDVNRLYFVRHELGTMSIWTCDGSGSYARRLWNIPANQKIINLLSYQGQPLVVLEVGGKYTIRQQSWVIRTFNEKGWLSQTLYDPNDDWSWTTTAGRVVRFWPDGSSEAITNDVYCSGLNRSAIEDVSADGVMRQIPILVKKGPKTPWDQFSWTTRVVFPAELPIIVLKSGELWWVLLTAKYRLPDYEQDKVVEVWATQVARLTTYKIHGSVDGFSVANPQRLYATSGGNIWRLDFGTEGTEWCQTTGGERVVRQETKQKNTSSIFNSLEDVKQKVQGLLDKLKNPFGR
jgi:hypothetical protein